MYDSNFLEQFLFNNYFLKDWFQRIQERNLGIHVITAVYDLDQYADKPYDIYQLSLINMDNLIAGSWKGISLFELKSINDQDKRLIDFVEDIKQVVPFELKNTFKLIGLLFLLFRDFERYSNREDSIEDQYREVLDSEGEKSSADLWNSNNFNKLYKDEINNLISNLNEAGYRNTALRNQITEKYNEIEYMGSFNRVFLPADKYIIEYILILIKFAQIRLGAEVLNLTEMYQQPVQIRRHRHRTSEKVKKQLLESIVGTRVENPDLSPTAILKKVYSNFYGRQGDYTTIRDWIKSNKKYYPPFEDLDWTDIVKEIQLPDVKRWWNNYQNQHYREI